MASGKTHDASIVITTPVILGVLLHYKILEFQQLVIFCIFYLFSGFYLSPDIDTKSVVFKRYGIFKIFWKPYQRAFPHKGNFFNRNFYTHFPVVATTIRLGYFLIIPILVLYFNHFKDWEMLKNYLILLYMATESSSFTHLILDIIYTKRR